MIRETNSSEASALLTIISNTLKGAGVGYVGVDGAYHPYHPDYAYLNPVRMSGQSLIGRINRESMFDIRLVDDSVEEDPRDLTRNTRNMAAIYMADPFLHTEASNAGLRDEAYFYLNSGGISNMGDGAYLVGRIPKWNSVGLLVEKLSYDGGITCIGCIDDKEGLRSGQPKQLMIVKVGDTFFFGDGDARRSVRVYERLMYDDVSNPFGMLDTLPKRLETISRREVLR